MRLKQYQGKGNVYFLIFSLLLILFPFVNEDRNLLIIFTQIFIFAIFAMSYDVLLGFTGIISFGHAMFFGIGAYSTSIFMKRFEAEILYVLLAFAVGIIISAAVSYIVGLLTLRLKAHFYAMLTLALANLFYVGAEKWRSLTEGADGFTFRIPEVFRDRTSFYLICLICMIIVYFLLMRLISSPLGKVLLAIKENEQRTESLGYNVLHYKIIASVIAGILASVAGSLYAMSLRFVNTSVFAMDVTLDALLMTIIGGVGTVIGAIIGSGVMEFAHYGLTNLAKVHWIFERWIIFFGIVYILAVMFFPKGIVGAFHMIKDRVKRKKTSQEKDENKKLTG